MAAISHLWWTTPVEIITSLSSAWNSGASSQPSWLAWPMLEQPSVPAKYSGRQARFLLSRSDKVFPKVNALGTVPNLLLTIVAWTHRKVNPASAQKWPFLLGAFACNVGATLWALYVMIPINTEIRNCTVKLDQDEADVVAEMNYREATRKWKMRGLGRAMLMMGAALCGVYSIYLDGKYGISFNEMQNGGVLVSKLGL